MGVVDDILVEIEERWVQVAPRSIANVIRAHPDEQFYAAGFWLFYFDYSVINPPSLATNSEARIAHYEDGENTRWVSADWKWSVITDTFDKLFPLYNRLSAELEGAADADWDQLCTVHENAIARVARKLTADAQQGAGHFAGLSLTNDFVVAILDGSESSETYNRLVRASVAPELIDKLEGILITDRTF
jgi:hypothetical protein